MKEEESKWGWMRKIRTWEREEATDVKQKEREEDGWKKRGMPDYLSAPYPPGYSTGRKRVGG